MAYKAQIVAIVKVVVAIVRQLKISISLKVMFLTTQVTLRTSLRLYQAAIFLQSLIQQKMV